MNKVHSILWGLKFRSSLLYHYLFNKKVRKRTAWHEMRYHLFSPRMYAVANERATLINKDEKYSYYRIKGYDDTFIYPASAPLYSFAMVMAEARPQHWHYYEIPQTAVAPGDVVVDCGSAEGFFAFKHQHTASRIFVLEPLPLFVDSLRELFRHKNKVIIIAITTYHEGQDYEQLIALIKGVVPEYNHLVKGIHYISGNPVMLHMWI
ncbi:hypothetical protein [Chitinophaga polysaccharea]|uniref:hypothetical protein n=1 Tax=Chitinophaga polysaccharea TaxID=1293035 RepID=UPI001157B964|nr:hypothetical protein [Chitinophaga polysaccharea]